MMGRTGWPAKCDSSPRAQRLPKCIEQDEYLAMPMMMMMMLMMMSTREQCSGRRRGLSCSAECPLHAYGSIGSVRGLRRPQTTIDASSVVDLSAPMCSRPSHEQFFRSRVSLLRAADVAGN
ncbi:hypothetical protein THAOC_14634 [Thalassiosira oceanica]|uniref:Uncharacterized protein n=1 Tax=Thalassiosira oceanica TaxID=159749 RepID=K0SGX4_THAOC|nr:hypothetical protein THAOC_14634 [Thalassiosira oceanica]|eukprot:EJK64615.1 hypothetical protein THAOC_14634 [Thalassiosira oceanica]